jgi:AraC-like DNA-binding protein
VEQCSFKCQHLSAGLLFVVPPQDTHFFIFNERTVICIIKFHEGFFETFLREADFKQLLSRFTIPNRKVLLSTADRAFIIQIMQQIIAEDRNASIYQEFIIKSSLALVLALMAKNGQDDITHTKDEKIQHITNKTVLSIEHMASQFNLSKGYFNQYFSKATGSSYKKYIQQYALNLIAQQLVQSTKTVSQLAYEFGYTDESHLSNAFKTHFGQSPSVFRKANQP